MVVAGQVNGTVKVGDEVLLTKLGSDDDEPFRTAVYGIQVGEDRVMEATNQKAVLWVEDATKFFPYVGTVLHSEGVTEKQLYSAYINALGERFIGVEGGVLTDMDRAHLTVSDVAESGDFFYGIATQMRKTIRKKHVKKTSTRFARW